jgi:hypothetical protein
MMSKQNGSSGWGIVHPVFLFHCRSGCAVVELTPIGEEFSVEPVGEKTEYTTRE